MKLVRGDKLPPDLQREVLAGYVYRWTHENAKRNYGGKCPACEQQRQFGGKMEVNGKSWHDHHVPVTTDAEWLKEHAFYVTKAGKLSRRHKFAEPAYMIETEGDGTS